MIGVRQRPRGDEPIDVRSVDQLDELLPQADHVVNVLPLSERTRAFFNAARFARMRPSAAFYNVGRGDTVDQAALRDALVRNGLAAAWLDVTTPEPLPPDDPLWTAPRCHITPHVAGGMQEESTRLVTHFLRNFERFGRGEPLRNRVM
jgi:phosphoglycerate dehydrogenase-like enzyme